MEPAIETIKTKKNIGVLRWILIIGIVIILNLFFYFAIQTVYPEPQFDNFCKTEQVNVSPTTKDQCVTNGGQWNESAAVRQPVAVEGGKNLETTSYCDAQFTCRQNFEVAQKTYNRNIFVALVVLGIISLIAGIVLSSITVVSLGLSLGGVLSLVIASMRYWSAMDEYVRVIILAVALVALIWLGVKKFKD